MKNISRTTLRELKKRYLNVLKKCFLANLMAFGMVTLATPATAGEDRLVLNLGEKIYLFCYMSCFMLLYICFMQR